jgi:hypothetical protein
VTTSDTTPAAAVADDWKPTAAQIAELIEENERLDAELNRPPGATMLHRFVAHVACGISNGRVNPSVPPLVDSPAPPSPQ